MLDAKKTLLKKIDEFDNLPASAYSIRENGQTNEIHSNSKIQIIKKENNSGMDIFVKENTKNQVLHIPVIIFKSNIKENVYNDFVVNDNCEITIIAGCGIYNCDLKNNSEHNGIHSFKIGKNCKIKYIEKHLGIGSNSNKNLSPITKIELGMNSIFEMETAQISGIDFSKKKTIATIKNNAKLIIKEKVFTENKQKAKSKYNIKLQGKNSAVQIISRSIAKNNSLQDFSVIINGNNSCYGRVECDGIIFDKARIFSSPSIKANDKEASLSHEAQIGQIAKEQLTKLMCLGLTKPEAEEKIIQGYLQLN